MKMDSWWDNLFRTVLKFCCKDTRAYDTNETHGSLSVCVPNTADTHRFKLEPEGEGLLREEPAIFDGIPEESEHETFHRTHSNDT
jgi:hypothetical protein